MYVCYIIPQIWIIVYLNTEVFLFSEQISVSYALTKRRHGKVQAFETVSEARGLCYFGTDVILTICKDYGCELLQHVALLSWSSRRY